MSNLSGAQKRKIHQSLTSVLATLDAESGAALLAKLPAFSNDLAALVRKYSAKAPKFFASATTFALGAVAGKKTKQCFTSKRWYYRSGDLDNWLPTDQSGTDAGTITVLKPRKAWTFAQAAFAVLNVPIDTPTGTLISLLKERGHTMTLPQIEEMVEARERGEDTGLVTNDYGNSAFVENEDGSVAIGSVHRDGSDWHAYVDRLDNGHRWNADGRLLVRNLDPSKFGL